MSAFAHPSGLVHDLFRLLFSPPTRRTYEGRNLSVLTPVAPRRADHINNQVNFGKLKPPDAVSVLGQLSYSLVVSISHSRRRTILLVDASESEGVAITSGGGFG